MRDAEIIPPPLPDQSAGLRQQAALALPRWISVVQHGDKAAEMDALWHICTGIHTLGYSLCVLDATATESSDTPGLQDMLEHAFHPTIPSNGTGWPIVPAALGIPQWLDSRTRLVTHRAAPQAQRADHRADQRLSSLFRAFGVLVVYADAQTLTALSPLHLGSAVVALSPEMPSLLSAYNGLKLLTQGGALEDACVVTVSPCDSPLYLAHNIAKSLQKCTMKFLQCEAKHFDTRTRFDAESPSEEVRKLVIHLLEASAPHQPQPTPQRQVRRGIDMGLGLGREMNPLMARPHPSRQSNTPAWSH